MIRKSQAFASFRHAVILECNTALLAAIPEFNSEAEDIRRRHEEDSKDPAVGEALADHHKRARVQDMLVRRNEFVATLQTKLQTELNERLTEYGASIEKGDKDGKSILTAKFPDGSMARVPKSLWIDYKQFQRV